MIVDERGTVCLTIDGFCSQRMTGGGVDSRHADDEARFYAEKFITIPAPAELSEGANPGAWLVLPDRHGICKSMAGTLTAKGATVEIKALDDPQAADASSLQLLLGDWAAHHRGRMSILVGWPLDTRDLAGDADTDAVQSAVERNVLSTFVLGQALDGLRDATPGFSVWVLTRGARSLAGDPPMS